MVSARAIIVLGLALATASVSRSEPAVVGLARSYLGPESTLDGVTSIHYVGTLERVDPNQPATGILHADMDMVLAKPMRQHLRIRTAKTTITTAIDDNADATQFRLTLLSAADIRALRVNTVENLFFYRGLTERGSVLDQGHAMIDGVECEHVDFVHGPGDVYERYFDRDTGRLVLTVHGPEQFRESGEIRVNGLRFPARIVNTAKPASGKEVTSTVTFTRITVNEPVDAALFAMPDYMRKHQGKK
jgi:hypothetical protein